MRAVQGRVQGCCEYGNEPSGSIEGGEFFGQLETISFSRKNVNHEEVSTLAFQLKFKLSRNLICTVLVPIKEFRPTYLLTWLSFPRFTSVTLGKCTSVLRKAAIHCLLIPVCFSYISTFRYQTTLRYGPKGLVWKVTYESSLHLAIEVDLEGALSQFLTLASPWN
jgi:hypothetical protein